MKQFLFLIFLFFAHLTSAQLKEFHISEREPDGIAVVQANNEYPDNAMILVYSDLDGLDFRSSIGGINQQRYNSRANRYEILMSPQRQILFVGSKGFIEQRIALINPSPKQVYYYLVEELRGQDETSVIFLVEPKDALLKIDSIEVEIDKTVKIPIGIRSIEISAEGYKTYSSVVDIRKDEVKYDFALEKLELILVKFKTNTSGASLEIDGKSVGVSDENGVFTWQLYPGIYDVKFQRLNYLVHTEQILVNEDDMNFFEIELVKNVGYIQIITDPIDVEVLINKKRIRDHKEFELLPGIYEITIRKSGFYDYQEKFEILIGEKKRIEVSLKPQTGDLIFISNPNNSKVLLQNTEGKVVEQWKGKNSLRGIPVGKYELIVSAQGYRTLKHKIEIRENQSSVVSVELEEPLSFQKLFVSKKYEPSSFLHLTYLPHLQNGQLSLFNSNYGINYAFSYKQWGGYIEYGRSLNFESSSLEYSNGIVSGAQVFSEGLTGAFASGVNIASYEVGAGFLYRFGIFTVTFGVSYYDYQFRQFAEFESHDFENTLLVNIPSNGFTGLIPKAGLRMLLKNYSIGYSVSSYHPQTIGSMFMIGLKF